MSTHPAPWKAGTARRVITPQQPMYMTGFAFRDRPGEKALHDLWAKVLVVEDADGQRVVFVCADIIGFTTAMAETIAERIQQAWGIERANIIFNASHTHSGPMLDGLFNVMVELDEVHRERVVNYTSALLDIITDLVAEAIGKLEPAFLSYGCGMASFAVNRRQPTPNGVINAYNPAGPSDFDVPVLKIATADGKLLSIVCGYACHTTVLSGYQFNGDWAGYAQIDLETKYPDAQVMFMMLCGADQNALPRGTVVQAQTYGAQLATAVVRVLSKALQPLSGPLKTSYETIELALQPHSRADFEAHAEETAPEVICRARHAQNMLQTYDEGRPIQNVPYPVQVIAFGEDCVLLALDGEVVVDYSLRAKRELGVKNLIVAGYSNGITAYIPSRRVLEEGGYEGGESRIYFGLPSPFAQDVEDRIFAAMKRGVDAVK